MTTSGSTNYSTNSYDIIQDALLECGVLAPGEAIQADMLADGYRVLNQMVKFWQTSGYNLWTMTRDTLTLANNKGTDTAPYTFGPGGDKTYRPLRFVNMRYRNSSGIERIMSKISRDEYDDQPMKAMKSSPTLFYYDPQLSVGQLHVWPIESDGGGGTLVFTYIRAIEDFDDNADTPDFPQEWYEPLVYGLAARLAPRYFPQDANMQQRLIAVAGQKLEQALSFDVEATSTYFKPDNRRRR